MTRVPQAWVDMTTCVKTVKSTTPVVTVSTHQQSFKLQIVDQLNIYKTVYATSAHQEAHQMLHRPAVIQAKLSNL